MTNVNNLEREEFPSELPPEGEGDPRAIVRRLIVIVQKTVYSDGWVDYDTEVSADEGGTEESVEDTEVLGLLNYAHIKMETVIRQGMRAVPGDFNLKGD